MEKHLAKEVGFFGAYALLDILGQCDSPGGAEYTRVWLEYNDDAHGMPPEDFILWRANRGLGESKNGK